MDIDHYEEYDFTYQPPKPPTKWDLAKQAVTMLQGEELDNKLKALGVWQPICVE